MKLAAYHGTTVGYGEVPFDNYVIEKNDGHVMVITKDTFNSLYFKITEFIAALREDCIFYEYRPTYVSIQSIRGQFSVMPRDRFEAYYDTGGNEFEH